MFQSKKNLCLSCLKFLVKMTIPLDQCEHFNQVKPFEKSHFLVVKTCHENYCPTKKNHQINSPTHKILTNSTI
jgi:hypothetical protein